MAECTEETLEDSSERILSFPLVTFGLLAMGIAIVGILVFVLIKTWLGDWIADWCLTISAGMPGAFACIWLWIRMSSWLHQEVTFCLLGDKLTRINKWTSILGKKHEISNEFQLGELIVLQSLNKYDETKSSALFSITPQSLLLGFKNATLRVTRASVSVSIKDLKEDAKAEQIEQCRNSLASWNKICERIEEQFVKTLSNSWRCQSSYARYQLLVQQAECAFLEAEATAFRMCRASLRTIWDWLKNLGLIAGGMLLTLFVVSIVIVGIREFLPVLGLGNHVHEQITETWSLALLGAALFFGLLFVSIELFQPLSARLRQESARVSLSEQLGRAIVLKSDFDPLLKLAKDDLDRIQSDSTRYTIFVALTGGMTQFLKQALEPQASDYLLFVFAVIIVLIQLYYFAQMQILRLIISVCLIAQDRAPEKKAGAEDYSMD